MMKNCVLLGCAAVLLLATHATAGIIVNVGSHDLQPDTPGQVITIPVTRDSGDTVEGLNLLLQIGDGGDALGGVDGSAPSITDVDLTMGTIFEGNNTGNNINPSNTTQFWEISTTTAGGTVDADGVLVNITIDTTGFIMADSFDLKVGQILGSINSDFAGTSATITNGQVNITIPEPSALMLLGLSCLTVYIRRLH